MAMSWDFLQQKFGELADAALARAQREAQAMPRQIGAEVGKQLDDFFAGVLAEINSDLRTNNVSDDSDSQ